MSVHFALTFENICILVGDNPVDSGEGATMCETWSINIIIALKATSTEDDLKYDLNQINQFLNNVGLDFLFENASKSSDKQVL